jgi:hypothetical protein
MEQDFVLGNGKVGRAFIPERGDIITIAESLFNGSVSVGNKVGLAGSGKLGTSAGEKIAVVLEKETFAGVFDDSRVGISIIFFLQNRLDYIKAGMQKEIVSIRSSVILSALALSGSIMLPIKKDQRQIQNYKKGGHVLTSFAMDDVYP